MVYHLIISVINKPIILLYEHVNYINRHCQFDLVVTSNTIISLVRMAYILNLYFLYFLSFIFGQYGYLTQNNLSDITIESILALVNSNESGENLAKQSNSIDGRANELPIPFPNDRPLPFPIPGLPDGTTAYLGTFQIIQMPLRGGLPPGLPGLPTGLPGLPTIGGTGSTGAPAGLSNLLGGKDKDK